MGYKPAVGIDHQLTAGETGICFKAAQHKSAGRIDEDFCLLIDAHIMAGAGNDQPAQLLAQLGRIFVCVMLAGDHDGVHALRHTERILHGHLRFSVRPDAGDQFFLRQVVSRLVMRFASTTGAGSSSTVSQQA